MSQTRPPVGSASVGGKNRPANPISWIAGDPLRIQSMRASEILVSLCELRSAQTTLHHPRSS